MLFIVVRAPSHHSREAPLRGTPPTYVFGFWVGASWNEHRGLSGGSRAPRERRRRGRGGGSAAPGRRGATGCWGRRGRALRSSCAPLAGGQSGRTRRCTSRSIQLPAARSAAVPVPAARRQGGETRPILFTPAHGHPWPCLERQCQTAWSRAHIPWARERTWPGQKSSSASRLRGRAPRRPSARGLPSSAPTSRPSCVEAARAR